jgi:NitT/TauT family transport system substrate-binding protein
MTHALRSLAFALGLAVLAGAAAAQTLEPVRVGTTNVASDVAIFIAEEKGYFRDEGIAVATTSFASAAKMIAPLGTGELDAGGGTVAAGLYNAVERGINIKVVADKASVAEGYEYSALLVRKDLADSGRYKSLADLRGMTIAAAAQGAGSESAINEALKKGGLKFSDVNVVYMGFPEMLAALHNEAIDAGVTNEPTVTRTIELGFAVRASPHAIYPGQQTAVVLFADAFTKKRHAVAQKFMIAYIRALRDYNDALKDGRIAGPGADAIIAILTKYTRIKDPKVYRAMTPFAANPNGHVNKASLQNDYDFFKSRGLISGHVTVDQVIDNSFADEAVRRLGAYRRKS